MFINSARRGLGGGAARATLLAAMCFLVFSSTAWAQQNMDWLRTSLYEGHGANMLLIEASSGRIEFANLAARRFYGFPDLLEKNINDINTLTEAEVRTEMRRAALLEQNHFSFRHLTVDGSVRDVEVYSYPVRLDGIEYLYSIIVDVSDRLAAERNVTLLRRRLVATGVAVAVATTIALMLLFLQLRSRLTETRESLEASEQTFSALFYGNPSPTILSLIETGRILDVNDACLATLGYDRGELIDRVSKEIGLWADPADRVAFVSRVRAKGLTSGFETKLNCRDGSVLDVVIAGDIFRFSGSERLLAVVTDISSQQRALDREKKLGQEKETLLREVHHRVKNNMNTISSLLALQAGAVDEPAAAEALVDAGNRLRSMQLLYDKLYCSGDISNFSIKLYLEPLVTEVLGIFPNSADVSVTLNIDDFELPARQLTSIGMIVYELITNTMKHAFPGQALLRETGKALHVSANRINNEVVIVIADTGTGFAADPDREAGSGFGLTLIRALSEQLEAELSIEHKNGTRVVLTFA